MLCPRPLSLGSAWYRAHRQQLTQLKKKELKNQKLRKIERQTL